MELEATLQAERGTMTIETPDEPVVVQLTRICGYSGTKKPLNVTIERVWWQQNSVRNVQRHPRLPGRLPANKLVNVQVRCDGAVLIVLKVKCGPIPARVA